MSEPCRSVQSSHGEEARSLPQLASSSSVPEEATSGLELQQRHVRGDPHVTDADANGKQGDRPCGSSLPSSSPAPAAGSGLKSHAEAIAGKAGTFAAAGSASVLHMQTATACGGGSAPWGGGGALPVLMRAISAPDTPASAKLPAARTLSCATGPPAAAPTASAEAYPPALPSSARAGAEPAPTDASKSPAGGDRCPSSSPASFCQIKDVDSNHPDGGTSSALGVDDDGAPSWFGLWGVHQWQGRWAAHRTLFKAEQRLLRMQASRHTPWRVVVGFEVRAPAACGAACACC